LKDTAQLVDHAEQHDFTDAELDLLEDAAQLLADRAEQHDFTDAELDLPEDAEQSIDHAE
jgi:hypothetical protein